jgi:ring-1,2-phenylacetyl-CoA epoxidase subunit PaaA
VVFLATGTKTQRDMVQEALNRWWEPIMHFFGPPDSASVHTEILMRWKVKMASNDDMRQTYLDMYVPKIWDLGLTLPDPNLKKNEATGKWEYTEPNWETFKQVINGNGPCNAERLAVRRRAEENGRWVRAAVMKNDEKYVLPLA